MLSIGSSVDSCVRWDQRLAGCGQREVQFTKVATTHSGSRNFLIHLVCLIHFVKMFLEGCLTTQRFNSYLSSSREIIHPSSLAYWSHDQPCVCQGLSPSFTQTISSHRPALSCFHKQTTGKKNNPALGLFLFIVIFIFFEAPQSFQMGSFERTFMKVNSIWRQRGQ